MRVLLTVLGGSVVLVLSFWITLKTIDKWPGARPSELEIAMAPEGITIADTVTGSIDKIEKDPSGRLELAGWAFDNELAEPVSILVLIGTKFDFIATTQGARDDVTLALKRSPEQTKNVVFAGRTTGLIGCSPFTVVAVNRNKHLSVLASDLTAPRCAS
jgi:hypothetical protein